MRESDPGVVLGTDASGHLVKRAHADRIPARWREPVDSTVAIYAERLGERLHSVYVRGSVPLGAPRDFVSDLDMFAVVTGPPPPDVRWAAEHSREVARRWPFVAGVEASVHGLDTAVASRPLAALIKLVGACVHGEDLAPGIRGFRPGIELVLHAWDLPRDTARARRILASAGDPGLVAETGAWIFKRVLRSGFELVMERAGCYTRDLVACWELFAPYHPRKAAAMEQALCLALSPRGDPERCLRILDELGEWLYEAVCAEYGAARIEQLLASSSSSAARGTWRRS